MARKFNLTIDQGSTYSKEITIDTIDASNYTSAASLKPWYTYGNTVSFTTSLTNTSIILEMTSNTTSALEDRTYVYDAEITNTSTGDIIRVIEGNAMVSPQIT